MLVEQQQEMGKDKGIVMDGRDIGTVVFPDAELKIFMTASPIIRAERRFIELQGKGDNVNFEEILKNVEERDYIDTHREDSPLVKAKDAIEFDNSNISKEEQFQKVLKLIPIKSCFDSKDFL
jgi:cytidylate kinase